MDGIVDLTDEKGRKQVGGKLEIAATLREPLSGEYTSHVQSHDYHMIRYGQDGA